MKKLFILLSLVLLVAIFSVSLSKTKQTEAASTRSIHTENDIIMRKAPSEHAIKITTLKNPYEVNVHSTKTGWTMIEKSGKKGYIPSTASFSENSNPTNELPPTVTQGLLPKVNMSYTYEPSFDGATKKTYHAAKNPYVNNSVTLLESDFIGYTYIESIQSFTLGIAYSDVFFFSLSYPIKQQATILDTDYGIESDSGTEVVVESTTTTMQTKAGKFENVIVIRYPNGSKLYIAKGFGIIRITNFEGAITTELVSVTPQK